MTVRNKWKALTSLSTCWLLMLVATLSNAQSWSVSKDFVGLAWDCTVYIESVYHKAGSPAMVNDTLCGSAFLVADSGKIYLVTAKHIVQASLMAKNQQSINTAIFVGPPREATAKLIKLPLMSKAFRHKQSFIFSPDKEDLAIIALTDKKYKSFLAALHKQNCKPIAIDSINTSNNHQRGDGFFLSTFMVFKNDNDIRVRSEGILPGKIKTYNLNAHLFKIDETVRPSNSGSAIFVDNKIIGMITRQDSIADNVVLVKNPYKMAKSATVVKASYLMALLRKLQQNEKPTTILP